MTRKRQAVRTLAALAAFAAVSTAAHAQLGTTLNSPQSKDQPFAAAITVADTGKPVDGRKVVAYHVVLSAKSCHSDIAGTASFFSKTDEGGDDSAFLPNGQATKINMFKGSDRNGNVELVMDVESKHPRLVDFTLTGAPVLPGSCVPKEGVGIEFYGATK